MEKAAMAAKTSNLILLMNFPSQLLGPSFADPNPF
jgi:hypothetical protein